VRLPNRDLQIFSLSALDVLAMACGVFVLLLVLLMPYYRRSFDLHAAIEAIRASTASASARTEAAHSELDRLRGEADRARAEAARLEAETGRMLAQARSLAPALPPPQAPARPRAPDAASARVQELDLVFIVDTTASMGPALSELAASMRAVVRILGRLVPSVRVGIAAYSDSDTGLPPPPSLTLTPADGAGLAHLVPFIETLSASVIGSRSVDEDMHLGVEAALRLPFRPGARQALVLLADAPPHDWARSQVLSRTRAFAMARPGRTVSALFVWTPGSRRNEAGARLFLQQVALAGGGHYSEHVGGMVEDVLLSVLTE
jgi:hypothetical protein